MASRYGNRPTIIHRILKYIHHTAMGKEIEHKYLVINDQYITLHTSATHFKQGYLTTDKKCVVRVRIAGDKAYLTIKGESKGATRQEYEIEIDTVMAQSMLDTMCSTPIIEKTRYICPYQGHIWEVDRFEGCNEGLIIAEIELQDELEEYKLPPFVGTNVTTLPRYYNSCLSLRPYSTWEDAEKECKDI